MGECARIYTQLINIQRKKDYGVLRPKLDIHITPLFSHVEMGVNIMKTLFSRHTKADT